MCTCMCSSSRGSAFATSRTGALREVHRLCREWQPPRMQARSRTNCVPQPPSWSLECVPPRLPACLVIIQPHAPCPSSFPPVEAPSDTPGLTRARACSLRMSRLAPWASGCVPRAAVVSENKPRPLSKAPGLIHSTANAASSLTGLVLFFLDSWRAWEWRTQRTTGGGCGSCWWGRHSARTTSPAWCVLS